MPSVQQKFINETNNLYVELIQQEEFINNTIKSERLEDDFKSNETLINIMQKTTNLNDQYSKMSAQIKHLKSAYNYYCESEYEKSLELLVFVIHLSKCALLIREKNNK